MEFIIICLVSFLASVAGAICGIGGGVIIKPVLDSTGIIAVDTVNFLSGCTVLAMTAVSVLKKAATGQLVKFDKKIGTYLALGASAGGVAGKLIYQFIIRMLADKQRVGAIQAGLLLAVTLGTFVYTCNKNRIKTLCLKGNIICVIIGCMLGLLSSLLGIGGGPINLVVLFYFFSMETKVAAAYSLYIIMFSQIFSLMSSFSNRTIPSFKPVILLAMIGCGVIGGLVGNKINMHISEKHVEYLFLSLMGIIIFINIYNIMIYI